jgi:phosphocarrier protein HPr
METYYFHIAKLDVIDGRKRMEPMKTSRLVKVNNEQGIHMRPAALIVSTASRFDSEIQLQTAEKVANAKNILEVASLGASQDTMLEITAEGYDAKDAIDTIADLIIRNFNFPTEKQTA